MLHGKAVASTVSIVDLTGVARIVYSAIYHPTRLSSRSRCSIWR